MDSGVCPHASVASILTLRQRSATPNVQVSGSGRSFLLEFSNQPGARTDDPSNDGHFSGE